MQQSGGHASAISTQRYLEYDCAADGTRAAAAGNGDFGTSPICGQLSGTPLVARTQLSGVSRARHKGRSRNKR
jgi:hypothetical protein